MQAERREKLTLVFNQVVWRTTASVTRPKYLARWPTFTCRLINALSIFCKTWFFLFFHTFSNRLSFRTTANALGARTWTPEEEEAKCQAAAKEETQPTPWSRRRARWHSRELPGKGSTWARGGSSRAPACAPSCCRRRRPWTQMTKVRLGRCGRFVIFFYICLFCIRSGRLILIVGCGRAQRRTATFLLRQPGGGGGHVPVPARPGRGGREEGEGHRADREDRPRGVWPLPCTDHRLCRQGEEKLTDWETPLEFCKIEYICFCSGEMSIRNICLSQYHVSKLNISGKGFQVQM